MDRQAKQQGLPPRPTPKDLGKKIDTVNVSTASLGKFHEKLPMEPKHSRIKGKRKFDPVVASSNAEASPAKQGGGGGKTKKAKKEGGSAGEGAAVGNEKKQNLTIFENLMKKQEHGDPSFVPDKKVLEMQKQKLGKRDRKNAY